MSDIILGNIVSNLLLKYISDNNKNTNNESNITEQQYFDKHCDVIKDIIIESVNKSNIGVNIDKNLVKLHDVISFLVNSLKKAVSDNSSLVSDLENARKDLAEKTDMLSNLLLNKPNSNGKQKKK